MGVSSVWDQIKPGQEKRVPLRYFTTQFQKKNKRPVRLAIDGFMMLFEARHGGAGELRSGYGGCRLGVVNYSKLVSNFISKIRIFLSLDISFIIVFDGVIKPPKRRKKSKDYFMANFEIIEQEFQTMIQNGTYRESFEELNVIRNLLRDLNVEYLDAPGEAEAQCAWLQANGYVDYVLTNDSDVLINGATAILKNLSKYRDDHGTTAKQTANSVKSTAYEYFITPIHMDQVKEKTGLTKERLLLFAILLGADYHTSGVSGIGEEKAKHIVLSGTSFMTKHKPEFNYQYDFSQMFYQIYSGNLDGIKRRELYIGFQKTLLKLLSQDMKAYFGKNYNIDSIGFNFPSDTIVMFYSKPFVLTNPFKFKDNTLNNAESSSTLIAINKSNGYKLIEFLSLKRSEQLDVHLREDQELEDEVKVKDFHIWMNETMSEALLTKVIRHMIITDYELIHFDKDKVINFEDIGVSLSLLGARVRPFLKFQRNQTNIKTEIDQKLKPKLMWVVRDSLPDDNQMVVNYENMKEEKEAEKILMEEDKKSKVEERKRKAQERKISPKRKSPKKSMMESAQSTNLDSIGFIPQTYKSPVKLGLKSPPNLSYLFNSPRKLFENGLINSDSVSPIKSISLQRENSLNKSPSRKRDIINLIESSPRIKFKFDSDELQELPSSSPTNRKLDFSNAIKTKKNKERSISPKIPSFPITSSSFSTPGYSSPTKKKFYVPVYDNSPIKKPTVKITSSTDVEDINPFYISKSQESLLNTNEVSKLLQLTDKNSNLQAISTQNSNNFFRPDLKSYEDPIELSSNESTPKKITNTILGNNNEYEIIEILSSSDEDSDITIVHGIKLDNF